MQVLCACYVADKLYHLCREVQCRNAMLSCITSSLGVCQYYMIVIDSCSYLHVVHCISKGASLLSG